MKRKDICQIAKSGELKKIISNITKNSNDEDYRDLEQDIYLELLEKDEETISKMIDNGQINYYLIRIVTNNIKSKTSRFYYKYRKNKKQESSIEDEPIRENGETPNYY